MKISVTEEIKAPQDHVFASISDFPMFEQNARQRGAIVTRSDELGVYGVGTTWQVVFKYRGKKRDLNLVLENFSTPDEMQLVSNSSSVEGEVTISLHSLGPNLTQVNIDAVVQPKTLAARLLLQSMKLAKGRIKRRFQHRILGYVRDIEDNYDEDGG